VDEDETVQIYHSRIEEVVEKHTLLSMPSYKGINVVLSPGTKVLVRFILEGGVYQFFAIYIEHRYAPIPVWVVGPPFDIKQIQRRSFYRLDAHFPVALRLREAVNKDASEPVILQLYSKDISGGGIRVFSKEALSVGTEVAVELLLPTQVVVPTQGKVVRLEAAAPESTIYWVSIEFVDIDERDRKNIIQFVFLKQLKQR